MQARSNIIKPIYINEQGEISFKGKTKEETKKKLILMKKTKQNTAKEL